MQLLLLLLLLCKLLLHLLHLLHELSGLLTVHGAARRDEWTNDDNGRRYAGARFRASGEGSRSAFETKCDRRVRRLARDVRRTNERGVRRLGVHRGATSERRTSAAAKPSRAEKSRAVGVSLRD